jgi:sugar/nucleoside kinase (ribokinase family)
LRETLALERKTDVSDVLIAGHIVIDEIIDFSGQVLPRRSLGGPVSYSSIALSSLGFNPEVVTKIGEDFPTQYSELLRTKAGIDVERFKARNEKTTSFRIDRSVEPRRMWLLSRCRNLSRADFPLDSNLDSNLLRGKALIVNTVANEISLSLLDRITKEFDHVFVDSQGFVRRFSKTHEVEMRSGLDISSLSGVDFLKADRNELSAWTGSKDLEASLRQIGKFVRYVIVTSGPSFAEIFEGQRLRWRTRPLEVKIADTTGAGDIFLAVFAAWFCKTENIQSALASSSCAATLALERSGIEKAILEKERLETETPRVEVLAY